MDPDTAPSKELVTYLILHVPICIVYYKGLREAQN